MKHRMLQLFAGVLLTLGELFQVPALLIFLLPTLSPWLWPVTVLLLPIALPFFVLHCLTQPIGSFLAYMLQEAIGIHATVEVGGLSLKSAGDNQPQHVPWPEVVSIRRVYERFFPCHQVRFRDSVAYQVRLQSGESLYVDFVPEAELRDVAAEYGVCLEGFDKRLQASDHEPGPGLPASPA